MNVLLLPLALSLAAGPVPDAPAANPLLAEWTAPFGLPPFDQIRPAHFQPAFEAAMAAHRSEVEAIATRPDARNSRCPSSPRPNSS